MYKKLFAVIIILLWMITGAYTLTYHYTVVKCFDLHLSEAPAIIFAGAVIGPFALLFLLDDPIIIHGHGSTKF